MKKFYSHLIEIEELTIELDSIGLNEQQKQELAMLLDSNIHNVVMDAILTKLPEQDKAEFAKITSSKNHEQIWKFLKSKSEDIETEIRKAAKEIKQKMKEDIKEAKKK